ncbi:MAG TPA: cytidylate kinase-like family protein [Thermodesulfobacteriota bacterium]|nr:cytidylate kinase-like family protein [Thermodesulfobacteriota bacterium]
MALVTIRGQLGSGAPEVGKLIAAELRADFVDREIIARVAARLDRGEADVVAKESPPGDLLGRIAEALGRNPSSDVGFAGSYLPVWEIPLEDARYFQALESVIRELAQSPSIVINGRGSQFILKSDPRVFHVQVVATPELRVRRVMEDRKLGQDDARREMLRFDNSARKFIKRYFQVEVDDPAHYDLTINTGRLAFKAAAAIVIGALSARVQA